MSDGISVVLMALEGLEMTHGIKSQHQNTYIGEVFKFFVGSCYFCWEYLYMSERQQSRANNIAPPPTQPDEPLVLHVDCNLPKPSPNPATILA